MRLRNLPPSSLVFKIFRGKKQNKNDFKNPTIPEKKLWKGETYLLFC